jgi:hypothetical protein
VATFEFREGDLRCHIIEHDFHSHAHMYLIERAIDDVTHHADPFIELDESEVVRNILLETRGRTMADGKGIDGSLAACLGPLHVRGKAPGAEITGIEMVLPT